MIVTYCPRCHKPTNHAVIVRSAGKFTSKSLQCVGCYQTTVIKKEVIKENEKRWYDVSKANE
jgi:hypothetical protein